MFSAEDGGGRKEEQGVLPEVRFPSRYGFCSVLSSEKRRVRSPYVEIRSLEVNGRGV